MLWGTAAYALVTFFLWLFEVLKKKAATIWRVVLYQKGACKEVKGLYDTGNGLWDATCRKPVSVISYSLIKELFSLEMQKELEAFCTCQLGELPGELAEIHPHYIPFQSVGCQGGFLPAVILDYIDVYKRQRLYRDCRIFTIYEGTSQVQQIVISGQLFK